MPRKDQSGSSGRRRPTPPEKQREVPSPIPLQAEWGDEVKRDEDDAEEDADAPDTGRSR